MTIFERKAISEAYAKVGEDAGAFSIKVTKIYEDENGEEVDREDVMLKSFDSEEDADRYIRMNYAPIECDDAICYTERKSSADGWDYFAIETDGFTYNPHFTEDDGIDEGCDEAVRETTVDGDEIVMEYN